jgi:hypothetical protein
LGLASWVKEVIRDTGDGLEEIPVSLVRTPGVPVEMGAHGPEGVPLYYLRLGVKAGFEQGDASIPIFRRVNDSPHPILKEIHYCEVAGKSLEAANVYALAEKVQQRLQTIAPGGTLPLCYFEVPGADYSLAVYREGRFLRAPVLAGPNIKARDFAGIRAPIVRYLRNAGYLHPEQDPDVRVVRPSDLRLVPPAAVIRCLGDGEMWLPTVEGQSAEGPVVGLLSAAEVGQRRRGEPEPDHVPPSAPDVTALLRYLGGELTRTGRVEQPWLLYAAQVRPEIWAWTERFTDGTDRMLACYLEGEDASRLELPLRMTAAGESVVAVQEEGISVFMGGDEQALAAVVGRYLAEAGFIQRAGDLRTESVGRARPDSLDVDEIWTSNDTIIETPEEVTT